MIDIIFNGENTTVEHSKLTDFLASVNTDLSACAVAINAQFVPKSDYDNTELNSGDQVELLVPMQGG